MKITNKRNLPLPIYNAIQKGWYDEYLQPNSFSVTTLLKPNKLYWLTKHYKDVLTEDASNRIWSLMGSAMHSVLEKGDDDDALQECRLFMDLENGTLHGSFDHYKDGILSDFKFTSVWSVIYKETKIEEWTQQLNLYALLLKNTGFEVSKLQIVAILRDWSKSKAKFGKGYPQSQVVIIPIPLWSKQRQLSFAIGKITQKRLYENTKVDEIPECTEQERWQTPTVYAIHKVGRKSALKLHDNLDDARTHLSQLNTGNIKIHYLDTRHGIAKRCENYCPVSKYCNWYQNKHSNKEKK